MPLNVPASAGQDRWSGFVEPEAGLSIPCTILRGRSPGPRLLVTAGVHGAEYSSIEAARRLTRMPLDELKGELTVLPVLNIDAFWQHRPYFNPRDGKNINRVFPGKADGSPSERLTAWVSGTAMPGMDGYIDLHCGDIIEALLPFAIFPAGHDRSRDLAAAAGFPYLMQSTAAGHSYRAAVNQGIPGVLLESGGCGLWTEESVTLIEAGVKRVMGKLGMLPDRVGEIPRPKIWQTKTATAPMAGYWHCAVWPGAHVEKGQPLGVIYDLVGPGEHRITSEVSGPVIYHVTSLAISVGEPLVGVATEVAA
ncbi:MAG TPA: succinylglutamate desuccinylase/aspartoacylase family protein [Stellaceae bacterium]|nr:succinylglutamate desuccinylase/aspartoacylase family protein [Stellaceae bacterium]